MTTRNSAGRRAVKKARTKARLLPIQPVTLVTVDGLVLLAPADVSPSRVGHKAYGLAALPPGWTPPFIVVDGTCEFGKPGSTSVANSSCLENLRVAIAQLGDLRGSLLIVRSSGTAETLSRRGSLESDTCRLDQVAATIDRLRKNIEALQTDTPSKIHWIVQIKCNPVQCGHLSNERRLREEPRDWIVETEQNDQREKTAEIMPLAVRQWRDGDFTPSDRLPCSDVSVMESALKSVAQWGMQYASRLHFEWVWDGAALNVVQLDVEEIGAGVAPHDLVPKAFLPVACESLSVFRVADSEEYRSFDKLKNVALYRSLGYAMPTFYVLDDQDEIDRILNGQNSLGFLADLHELTKQPLIIRVDGLHVPVERREMLPRSDELRSPSAAIDWLRGKFTESVIASSIQSAGLCIIAHHFLPAVSSAWARAVPNDRLVRVESLWGVPEGLYWYSHDTFEVDTLVTNANEITSAREQSFVIKERTRHKGLFVAPTLDGKWIAHVTKPPFDWRSSVERRAWLREIAATTRKIAEVEARPTAVMWLVGVHPEASSHQVIPWFHCESKQTGEVRAAPRRKISTNRDWVIHTVKDWNLLVEMPPAQTIDRVRVEPLEADLIRNPEFATSISELARDRGFVVELAGGVLSHIFYVLTRDGCPVECVDLFGKEADTLQFHKLVRDEIPAQIEQGGERANVLLLKGQALEAALKRKVVEEALEVLDAMSVDELRGELADVLEVVEALGKAVGLSASDLLEERERKNRKRGSFARGLMLLETQTPHTLTAAGPLDLAEEGFSSTMDVPTTTVDVGAAVQSTKLAVKPDLRNVGRAVEKLITFATSLPSLGARKGSTTFALPSRDSHPGPTVVLEVEVRRVKGELRGHVKIRTTPTQTAFEFDGGTSAEKSR